MNESRLTTQLEGEPRPIGRPTWLTPFGIAAFALLAVAQAYAIWSSPPDRDMGNLQKIMYVHVPAAWTAFLCFFIVFGASIRYLWTGRDKHDLVAAASAEVGAVLTALTLMLGSIWGRPTWGVWWTWDARLTSTAVLLVVFVGYLTLRAFTDDPRRRARWSAAIGILGALNVPIVYMSVTWWRTLHQMQSTPRTLSPAYMAGLHLNSLAAFFVVVFLILQRYHIARLERAAEEAIDTALLGYPQVDTLEVSHV